MKNNKILKKLMTLFIAISLVLNMVPASVLAAENTPPYWNDDPIWASLSENITLGEDYKFKLYNLMWFDDNESGSDKLTYKVSIDGAEPIDVKGDGEDNYIIKPTTLGTHKYYFTAFDGELESKDKFTLTLTVRGENEGVTTTLRYMISELDEYDFYLGDSSGKTTALEGAKNEDGNDMWKYFHINDMKAGIYNIITKKDDKFAGSFSFKVEQSDTKISMVKKSVSSIDGFIAGEDYTLSGVGSFDEELKITPAIDDKNYSIISQITPYDLTVTPSNKRLEEGYVKNTQRKWINVGENNINIPLILARPMLNSMTISDGETVLPLDKEFKSDVIEYTLTVKEDVKNVTVNVVPQKDRYEIKYNGADSNKIDITDIDKFDIEVTDSETGTQVTNKYTIKINKVSNQVFKINTDPEDAIVSVYDKDGNYISANEDGTYNGYFNTFEYTYTVSKYGYVSQSGKVPSNGGAIEVKLVQADDDGLEDVGSDWKNFRNSDVNMGITNANTPTNKSTTSLLWNKRFGVYYEAAPSVQIIVDNALIVMTADKKINKLDLETGEVLQTANMVEAPNWGYTPPIYVDGMIICPLSGGTIQAFNAKTLESLWVYTDSKGGQSLSPIAYSDGYIYTGFWNGDSQDANFVCLSVTDEDPSMKNEQKQSVWKHTQKGGFYWAGSVVIGDYVIVGTDDGKKETEIGTSNLISFNKKNGAIIEKYELNNAKDQRSSISYDEKSGRIYFTTADAYLYSAKVDKSTGNLYDIKSVKYSGKSNSTPIVHDGKVYFGIGGGIGGWGEFVVADAETLEEIFHKDMYSYPNSAMLMSTAYEKEGYLYFYSTYNAIPGGLSMIKVKTDANKADDVTVTELFSPSGNMSQYCISSVICGEDGTIYYKNDSCNIFAIGTPKHEQVIKLINNIGEVNLDSESTIEAARKAYEALKDEAKEKVSNIETLVKAEARLSELKVEKCESLINDIGTVTIKSEKTINEARDYYNTLSTEEQEKVNNYNKLIEAEKEFEKIKAQLEENNKPDSETTNTDNGSSGSGTLGGGNTTSGGTINLKKDEETKSQTSANQLINAINELINSNGQKEVLPKDFNELTEEQLKTIIDLYKSYENMSDSEKSNVTNYSEFEKILNKVGEVNHNDKETGLRIDGLKWNIKVIISYEDVSSENIEKITETLGKDTKLLNLFNIKFEDILTGKPYNPEKPVEVWLPINDSSNYKSYVVVHVKDDGTYEYVKCEAVSGYARVKVQDFSKYGVAGVTSTWDEIFSQSVENKIEDNKVNWIFIIPGVLGVIAIAGVIVLKKKNTDDASKGEEM